MRTSGNTILITGGTSGIGLGFAKAFLEADNTIIICGRREDRLQNIKKKYPDIITRVCDVSNENERKQLFNWSIENYPDLNVLINNAGIQLRADLRKPVDMERVHAETSVNFYAPVHLSSLFSNHLSKKENAAIINISSGLAFTPLAIMPIYCATKAALHSFSLTLRHQLKDQSIKVFEIIPPSVDTELGADFRSDPSQRHGGMPVHDFIEKTIQALKNDKFEAAIGESQNLYMKREELFGILNR